MSTTVLSLNDVSVRRGDRVILGPINFQIIQGERWVVLGPNGAGKSTLVKCLSGAHQPTSGQMMLEGKEVSWDSPRDAIEAGIETLYQDSGLAPHLTVGANVFLGREKYQKGLLGKFGFLDNKAMNREAHEDLERVGIAVPSSTRAISALSGGQRQAVAIGRAVSWASKVIILDEPTNHLGARQAGEVLEVMKAAKAKGLGVVFISHTLPHVLQVTDRIVVLRLGKIVANAPTSDFNADTLLGTITGLNTLK